MRVRARVCSLARVCACVCVCTRACERVRVRVGARASQARVPAVGSRRLAHPLARACPRACLPPPAQVVNWGTALYGELGFGEAKKSSANPKIVDALDGYTTLQTACGAGHTLALVDTSNPEDVKLLEKEFKVRARDDVCALARACGVVDRMRAA